MTIYYNANKSKDLSAPASLAIKPDRTTEKDAISFSEAIWSITDNKISFVAILDGGCVGIEDYNDKQFNPDSKKVAFSFFCNEHDVYDKETKKTSLQPTSDEQKLQFEVLKSALEKLTATNAVCASGRFKPAASGIALELYRSAEPEDKGFLSRFTSSMFHLEKIDPRILLATDTEFCNGLANKKPSEFKAGGSNYVPKETECDRLTAKWNFIEKQFELLKKDFQIENMPSLVLAISFQEESLRAAYEKALELTIKLVSGGNN